MVTSEDYMFSITADCIIKQARSHGNSEMRVIKFSDICCVSEVYIKENVDAIITALKMHTFVDDVKIDPCAKEFRLIIGDVTA